MSLADLRDLDFENVGGWPPLAKWLAVIVVIAAIGGAGYYFKTSDQLKSLKSVEAEEQNLRQTFESKQRKAANLDAYKAQLAEMKRILQAMLRQLPSKTEMPDLLVDISQTALATGIDNELFEPGAEVIKDFYAEKPISLRMIGTYHQFGHFVSGVASLPRVVILTMHDISLSPSGDGIGNLVLEGTAKTYRYVEEDEMSSTEEGGS